MDLSSIYEKGVFKPMDYPEIEEREEIAFHIESKTFSLDYQECMRIEDASLLEMMAERDEMD